MSALAGAFQVALTTSSSTHSAKIPRAQQKIVNKFVRQFLENPTSAAINYESIKDFVDPNLRTVRIDQA